MSVHRFEQQMQSREKGCWAIVDYWGTQNISTFQQFVRLLHSDFEYFEFNCFQQELILNSGKMSGEIVKIEELEIYLRKNRSMESKGSRLMFSNFNNLQLTDQCFIMHKCRQLSESECHRRMIQAVFHGQSWNFITLKNNYQERFSSSPYLNEADIYYAKPFDKEDIKRILRKEKILSWTENLIEDLCVQHICGATGGNAIFVKAISDLLLRESVRMENCLDKILVNVCEISDICSMIEKQYSSLAENAKIELENLYFCHRIRCRRRDPVTEELILSGLVAIDGQEEAGNVILILASPCIDTVLRNELSGKFKAPQIRYSEFGQSCDALMTYAYHEVMSIENLLRRLLVSYWQIQGIDVKKGLEGVNVGSGHSLYSRAKGWQRRQSASTDQQDLGLVSFLTSGNLKCAFNDPIYGLVKEGNEDNSKPFSKSTIEEFWREFTPIRDAVAHNQPLCLSIVNQLAELRKKLVRNISNSRQFWKPQKEF